MKQCSVLARNAMYLALVCTGLFIVGCTPESEETSQPVEDLVPSRGTPGGTAESKPRGEVLNEGTIRAADWEPRELPSNLEELFQQLQRLSETGDDARLRLGQSLIPDESRLLAGLDRDIAPEILARAKERIEVLGGHDAALAQLFTLPKGEIEVVGGTKQLLSKYTLPRIRRWFPRGVQSAASLLRKDLAYYNVTVGDRMFHLIYWDGEQWSMLGRLWRDLGPEGGEAREPAILELPSDTPPEARTAECAEMVDHIIGLLRRDRPDVLSAGEMQIRTRMMESCTDVGVRKEDRECILAAKAFEDLSGCNTH